MSKQPVPGKGAVIGAAPKIESVDTATVSGIKCVRAPTSSQSWRDRVIDVLNGLRGPHPRSMIVTWDGSAFQFRRADNISQRVVPD